MKKSQTFSERDKEIQELAKQEGKTRHEKLIYRKSSEQSIPSHVTVQQKPSTGSLETINQDQTTGKNLVRTLSDRTVHFREDKITVETKPLKDDQIFEKLLARPKTSTNHPQSPVHEFLSELRNKFTPQTNLIITPRININAESRINQTTRVTPDQENNKRNEPTEEDFDEPTEDKEPTENKNTNKQVDDQEETDSEDPESFTTNRSSDEDEQELEQRNLEEHKENENKLDNRNIQNEPEEQLHEHEEEQNENLFYQHQDDPVQQHGVFENQHNDDNNQDLEDNEVLIFPEIQAEAIDDFDESCTVNMANAPAIFRGCSDDDAEAWMRYMSIWLATQERTMPTERARISSAMTHMRDAAQSWAETLTIINPPAADEHPEELQENEVRTYQQFREKFLNQFRRGAADQRYKMAELWRTKQQIGQKTEDYVNIMRNLGRIANANEAELTNATNNGLRYDIKQTTDHHEDLTLNDIIKWGRVAERHIHEQTNNEEVKSMILDLQETVNELHVRPVENTTNERRYRSPSRNVHFNDQNQEDYQTAPIDPGRQQIWTRQNFQRESRSQSRDNTQRFGNNFYRSQSNGGGNRNSGRNQYNTYHQQGNVSSQPGTYPSEQTYQGNQRGSRTERYSTCYRCGRSHSGRECLARTSQCFNCGRNGHWQSVCRSQRNTEARRNQN